MVKWADYLEGNGFDEVDPKSFYEDIFGDYLEKKGDTSEHRYHAIAREIYKDKKTGKMKSKNHIIYDGLEELDEVLKSKNFCIMSPIAYIGKHRTNDNARLMFALCVEIDNLISDEDKFHGIRNLFYRIGNGYHLNPTYIVCSGHGIHLYYVFDRPLCLFKNVKKQLMRYKKAITKNLWSSYITEDYLDPKMPRSGSTGGYIQYESPFQGFRIPGTLSKDGEKTLVFKTGKKVSIEEMNSLDIYEFTFIDHKYPVRLSEAYYTELPLAEAKQKYPEWYQRRVVEKQPKGHWVNSRGLYDWWKRKAFEEGRRGHRYYCVMCLAVYAVKCDIPFEELEKDAYELMTEFQKQDTEDNRFTEEDVECALQIYLDKDISFNYKRDFIQSKSGIDIPVNKRNGRPQAKHLQGARAIRDINHENWREGNGRPSKKEIVDMWRAEHPDGSKNACIRDTGLTKPTVYKWW